MANKTIIFKNTTGSIITIRGKSIPASSSVDFTGYQGAHQYQLAKDIIDPLLASGDLVVNNGISDLTVEEAEIFLYDELFFTMDGITDGDVLRGTATEGIAQATPFTLTELTGDIESTTAINGDVLTFDGTNFVPQAPAVGGGGLTDKIFTITFENPSSIGGDWLRIGDFPSNETPHIVPWACKLVALTFSNKESDADTELEIQAVNEGNGESPSPTVFTWVIDNARVARKTDFSPDVTFAKGDKIAIFAKSRGDKDPSQIKVIMYLTVTTADETSNIENYSGNIS